MAFDAISMHMAAEEIRDNCIGSRVDRIYMISADELVLYLNSRDGNYKLFMSCRANSARVHLTNLSFESPKQPPMLCMLFRKHLIGGRLLNVEQIDSERILYLDFECMSEIKERVHFRLVIETMGRHSDIILVNEDGIIVDAMKRVDMTMSSVRQVLPGIPYELPPLMNKKSIFLNSAEDITEEIANKYDGNLSKSLSKVIGGLSSIVCDEISFLCGDFGISDKLSDTSRERLLAKISDFQSMVHNRSIKPSIVYDSELVPRDFSFLCPEHFGNSYSVRIFNNMGQLLDEFFSQRDTFFRNKSKSEDLFRTINQKLDRIRRKIVSQKEELMQSEEREVYRIYGDLLSTYPHLAKKGMDKVDIPNYYDENNAMLSVPLSPKLSGIQNAQMHYKKYKKLSNAEEILRKQIEEGETELQYLDSVLDSLSRASGDNDLAIIRQELQQTGYIRSRGSKQMKIKPADPYHYKTSNGMDVLVGRNNIQNDRLTFHIAEKNDIWFHTTSFPGSHTILFTNGVPFDEIPVEDFTEAAVIAATHSKASEGARVRVDYSLVKNIKKPPNAKPGMVIFYENYSAYVTPDRALCERLIVK